MTQRRQPGRRRAVTLVAVAAWASAGIAGVSAAGGPSDLADDLESASAGCATSTSPDALERRLVELDLVVGYDALRGYELGDDRRLWMVQDAFLDTVGGNERLVGPGMEYVNNLGLLQEGRCFRAVFRGTGDDPHEFESGELPPESQTMFYWPLDGELNADGQLVIFWAQMLIEHPATDPPRDGLRFRPVSTWLGVYDADTLQRLEFRPAPDSGTLPMYGTEIVSPGDGYSYLFGNSNLLAYRLEGGFFGEHSSTEMYLARVPEGLFGELPEYYTGDGWSPKAPAAEPISSRYLFANQMHPAYVEGQWVAVTKRDELMGTALVVDVADDPWGPWSTVLEQELEPIVDVPGQATYHPTVLPWQPGDGTIRLIVSMNALRWDDAVGDPRRYQPFVVHLDVSEIDELTAAFGSG